MDRIKFNEPYVSGNELNYIKQALESGQMAGNGPFTRNCQTFFEQKWNFNKCLMTNSGTDALEMAAILVDINPGDEVIIPSFTFPSSALAFKRLGAKIVFVDSTDEEPCMDVSQLEQLITSKTKAIVPVHYAGVACDMDPIMRLATEFNLVVIEDAAHAIDGFYKNRPLGGIGHFGCFSFHESKNIHCGEGGMLVINEERYIDRAEIIWEKGTNRVAFYRGEIPKYECVDIGSSFLPSDITAAFLFAQLQTIDKQQDLRTSLWEEYFDLLSSYSQIRVPYIPEYATHNAHLFYIVTNNNEQRAKLIDHLGLNGINGVFHYQSLHSSPFFGKEYQDSDLPNSKRFSECLIRLPLHFNLSLDDIKFISNVILKGF